MNQFLVVAFVVPLHLNSFRLLQLFDTVTAIAAKKPVVALMQQIFFYPQNNHTFIKVIIRFGHSYHFSLKTLFDFIL